jgi:hypothetical protein
VYENLHFNSSILIDMGKDLCRALVTYTHSFDNCMSDLNLFIKNSQINISVGNLSTDSGENTYHISKPNLKKILLLDKNTIMSELKLELETQEKIRRENKEKEKSNLNSSGLMIKDLVESEEDSDGSDSEPSIDNYENDMLARLLPTHAKKKSN